MNVGQTPFSPAAFPTDNAVLDAVRRRAGGPGSLPPITSIPAGPMPGRLPPLTTIPGGPRTGPIRPGQSKVVVPAGGTGTGTGTGAGNDAAAATTTLSPALSVAITTSPLWLTGLYLLLTRR